MSAQHGTAHGEAHHVHVTPITHYFAVFGALLFLTFVTVWIAKFDFGAANTFIAMFVATIKASLVALVFMHLLYDERLNSLSFVFGLLFVALFFVFTLTDVMTRSFIEPNQDTLGHQNARVASVRLAAEQASDPKARYPKRVVGEDYPVAVDERTTAPPAAPEPVAPPPAPEGEGGETAPAVAAFAVDAGKVEKGKALFTSKTCSACHSIDGSRLVGPSLKGFWGRNVKLEGGATVLADAAYFSESIKEPNAKVNEGYPPAMPVLAVSDEEIDLLLHYVNSL